MLGMDLRVAAARGEITARRLSSLPRTPIAGPLAADPAAAAALLRSAIALGAAATVAGSCAGSGAAATSASAVRRDMGGDDCVSETGLALLSNICELLGVEVALLCTLVKHEASDMISACC